VLCERERPDPRAGRPAATGCRMGSSPRFTALRFFKPTQPLVATSPATRSPSAFRCSPGTRACSIRAKIQLCAGAAGGADSTSSADSSAASCSSRSITADRGPAALAQHPIEPEVTASLASRSPVERGPFGVGANGGQPGRGARGCGSIKPATRKLVEQRPGLLPAHQLGQSGAVGRRAKRTQGECHGAPQPGPAPARNAPASSRARGLSTAPRGRIARGSGTISLQGHTKPPCARSFFLAYRFSRFSGMARPLLQPRRRCWVQPTAQNLTPKKLTPTVASSPHSGFVHQAARRWSTRPSRARRLAVGAKAADQPPPHAA